MGQLAGNRQHVRETVDGIHDDRNRGTVGELVAKLCRGWQIEQVNQIVHETLEELINPFVYAEAAALIQEHRRAGRDVVVVSTSGEELVRPIAEQLGIDDIIATRMVVRDGKIRVDRFRPPKTP